jgi:hypothetical protein
MTEPEPAEVEAAVETGAPTGHPAVDEALERLAGVSGEPPAQQIEAYEAVHGTLQETLQNIEQG